MPTLVLGMTKDQKNHGLFFSRGFGVIHSESGPPSALWILYCKCLRDVWVHWEADSGGGIALGFRPKWVWFIASPQSPLSEDGLPSCPLLSMADKEENSKRPKVKRRGLEKREEGLPSELLLLLLPLLFAYSSMIQMPAVGRRSRKSSPGKLSSTTERKLKWELQPTASTSPLRI